MQVIQLPCFRPKCRWDYKFVPGEEKNCYMPRFGGHHVCYVSYPCPLLRIGGANYCGFEGGFGGFFQTDIWGSFRGPYVCLKFWSHNVWGAQKMYLTVGPKMALNHSKTSDIAEPKQIIWIPQPSSSRLDLRPRNEFKADDCVSKQTTILKNYFPSHSIPHYVHMFEKITPLCFQYMKSRRKNETQ